MAAPQCAAPPRSVVRRRASDPAAGLQGRDVAGHGIRAEPGRADGGGLTLAQAEVRFQALSTGGAAYRRVRFRIVRAAAATGVFNLNVGVGPLEALAAGQWCDVQYDGAAWVLVGFGSL